jgi:hypothetical protein
LLSCQHWPVPFCCPAQHWRRDQARLDIAQTVNERYMFALRSASPLMSIRGHLPASGMAATPSPDKRKGGEPRFDGRHRDVAFAPPGAAGFRKKDGGGAAHARSHGGGGARMGCRKRCDPLQRLGEFVVAAPDIGAILSAAIPLRATRPPRPRAPRRTGRENPMQDRWFESFASIVRSIVQLDRLWRAIAFRPPGASGRTPRRRPFACNFRPRSRRVDRQFSGP